MAKTTFSWSIMNYLYLLCYKIYNLLVYKISINFSYSSDKYRSSEEIFENASHIFWQKWRIWKTISNRNWWKWLAHLKWAGPDDARECWKSGVWRAVSLLLRVAISRAPLSHCRSRDGLDRAQGGICKWGRLSSYEWVFVLSYSYPTRAWWITLPRWVLFRKGSESRDLENVWFTGHWINFGAVSIFWLR